MNRSDTVAAIREELAAAAPDVPPDADTAAHFRHDLDVDSLAILEMVARLEYRYRIAVPDEDWPRLTSIDAVADYLDSVVVGAS